jgi:hypothetical protein
MKRLASSLTAIVFSASMSVACNAFAGPHAAADPGTSQPSAGGLGSGAGTGATTPSGGTNGASSGMGSGSSYGGLPETAA